MLSASKDESLRMWNVKNSTCVAIFSGHKGHRDCILSIGWHPGVISLQVEGWILP
jgi:WD40 repeat protein